MKNIAREIFLNIAWRIPWVRTLGSHRPVVLTYHGVPAAGNGATFDANTFEKQLLFIQRHFEIVSPACLDFKRKNLGKIQVILTFDDGFRNQAEVVAPILRRYSIPAIFFISSRHCTPGKYLWFAYLEALEKYFPRNGFFWGQTFVSMSPEARHGNIGRIRQTLLNLEPHPSAMYDVIDNELPHLEEFVSTNALSNHLAGMTDEQVGELASDRLFSLGIHTTDHPFLTKCAPDEIRHQILKNKIWIEQKTNKPCYSLAYPGGEYDTEVVNQSRDLGLSTGYALTPRLNVNPEFEVPRIGIYSESLAVLGFKVQWGSLVEPLRLKTRHLIAPFGSTPLI